MPCTVALLLGLYCALPVFAQTTLNPPYLREMPPVDRVLSDMQTGDTAETAARQMGALLQLKKMIGDAAGPRFYNRAVGLTPEETRIRQAYYTAYYQISQSRPEYKGIHALRGYDISPRFRDELFRRYFSPAFRTVCETANAAADAHTQARLRAERAQAEAMLNASGGYNPPRYAPAPQASCEPNAAANPASAPDAQAPGDSARENEAEKWRNEGSDALKQGKYQQANAAYKQYLTLEPDDPDAFILLGIINDHLNQYSYAAAAYSSAVRLKPDADGLYRAYLGLGVALYNLERYSNALEALQQAVLLKPNSADAQYWAGRTYFELKQYDKAVAPFQEAVRLNPNDPGAWSYLGLSYFASFKFPEDDAQKLYAEISKLE